MIESIQISEPIGLDDYAEVVHLAGPLPADELFTQALEEDDDRDSNTIEVFIRRLRKKLDPDDQLKPIETQRGRGYRFRLPRTQSEQTT